MSKITAKVMRAASQQMDMECFGRECLRVMRREVLLGTAKNPDARCRFTRHSRLRIKVTEREQQLPWGFPADHWITQLVLDSTRQTSHDMPEEGQ